MRDGSRSSTAIVVPDVVRAAYGLTEVEPAPHGIGLINLTVRARRGDETVVVQRQHPAFAASVNDDIFVVTERLAARGVTTPRLVLTRDGTRAVTDPDGRVWRALTFLSGGRSLPRVTSADLAREAGEVVARFHGALDGLAHAYVHVRPGIHDIAYRLAGLARARARHTDHRLAGEVAALAARVDQLAPSLLAPKDCAARMPLRHAHGDLKISNVLFDDHDRGVALVDLDTLASMPWVFEVGDALRSWCNTSGEDDAAPRFDQAIFAGALEGYRRAGAVMLHPAEREGLVSGVVTIAAELGVRFLTDALEESYFGFDQARFARPGEHNLLRARGQIALAERVARDRPELEETVAKILA